MTDSTQPQAQQSPTPDPALARLADLVGTWTIKGRPLGADEDNIRGETTFAWLEGEQETSFFLTQDMEMDYDGQKIRSHELIGYDPKAGTFASLVFSNMAPDPWPYEWDVDGDDITISIHKAPMDATFTGKFAPDRQSFSGGWRPAPGADKAVNAPYDLVATRSG
ncbi:hypothetical protein VW23_021275 [Devosia insulae DS-56]|uniref:DUF1579 domain-containing protein n=1 Tax=Devosia insulae DS-56 TaxID=1116389 RepID=A0A1E5XPA3_9HYPH|nr:hypothetical protein VW23_021275 [Devosia insulae DS-56]